MTTTNHSQGMALSMRSVGRDWDSFLTVPSQIGNVQDIYLNSRSQRRDIKRDVEGMYRQVKEFIRDFDENTEDYLKESKDNIDFEELDIDEIVENAKRGHRETGEVLTQVKENLLNEELNPTVYFMTTKHFSMSKIFLEIMEESNIELEELNQTDLDNESEKENFKLGVFLALEPILVTSAIVADMKEDEDFLDDYSQLMDRFSFLFSRRYRDEYEKETSLDEVGVDNSDFVEVDIKEEVV